MYINFVSLMLVSNNYPVLVSVKWNCRNTKLTSSYLLNPSLKMSEAIPPITHTYSGTGHRYQKGYNKCAKSWATGESVLDSRHGQKFLLLQHVKADTETQQTGCST
jgi:hypothetical protein